MGATEFFGEIYAAMPDFSLEILSVTAQDERCAVRWRATGTFTGDTRFEGFVANGASLEMEGLDLLTIRDGLVHENFAYTNATELARQFGAMPPAGSVGERAMLAAVNARTAAAAWIKRARNR